MVTVTINYKIIIIIKGQYMNNWQSNIGIMGNQYNQNGHLMIQMTHNNGQIVRSIYNGGQIDQVMNSTSLSPSYITSQPPKVVHHQRMSQPNILPPPISFHNSQIQVPPPLNTAQQIVHVNPPRPRTPPYTANPNNGQSLQKQAVTHLYPPSQPRTPELVNGQATLKSTTPQLNPPQSNTPPTTNTQSNINVNPPINSQLIQKLSLNPSQPPTQPIAHPRSEQQTIAVSNLTVPPSVTPLQRPIALQPITTAPIQITTPPIQLQSVVQLQAVPLINQSQPSLIAQSLSGPIPLQPLLTVPPNVIQSNVVQSITVQPNIVQPSVITPVQLSSMPKIVTKEENTENRVAFNEVAKTSKDANCDKTSEIDNDIICIDEDKKSPTTTTTNRNLMLKKDNRIGFMQINEYILPYFTLPNSGYRIIPPYSICYKYLPYKLLTELGYLSKEQSVLLDLKSLVKGDRERTTELNLLIKSIFNKNNFYGQNEDLLLINKCEFFGRLYKRPVFLKELKYQTSGGNFPEKVKKFAEILKLRGGLVLIESQGTDKKVMKKKVIFNSWLIP